MEFKLRRKWIIWISVYSLLLISVLLIANLDRFNLWLGRILLFFRPLIIGLVVAYLCNPFFRFFERKLFAKIHPSGLRRGISLLFTYLTLFLIIGILLMLIIPQLFDSIVNFIENAAAHLDRTVADINAIITSLNANLSNTADAKPPIPLIDAEVLKQTIANFFQSLNIDSLKLIEFLNVDMLTSLLSIAENVAKILTDLVFGLFISLYLLNSKEQRYAQIMRLRRALFSDTINQYITRVCTTADNSFGGFIKGKLLDSCIVGVLVYLTISMFRVPYAILIAVIVAITDIVPVIGPFVGVLPSAIIILLTSPGKVIPFLLCILIIQQIDGNIIAPKILGENTGVSSLCVLIAITTMGTLWGFVGMVLGVPLFATILELSGRYLDKRLRKKGMPVDTDYYAADLSVAPDASEPSKTLFQKLQTNQTPLPASAECGQGTLSRMEQFQLDTYELAYKHRLFAYSPDQELPAAFVEEGNELINSNESPQDTVSDPISQDANTQADSTSTEAAPQSDTVSRTQPTEEPVEATAQDAESPLPDSQNDSKNKENP